MVNKTFFDTKKQNVLTVLDFHYRIQDVVTYSSHSLKYAKWQDQVFISYQQFALIMYII